VLTRLRAAPITAPTLLAACVLLAWTPLDGGQPITRWAPGAIVLLALLGLALAALPPLRWGELPPAVRVATLALAAYTAWSFLSIAWADDGGVALEGADRTLLYLAAFLLFALWPQRPATAAWVLGLWTFGIGAIAVITLVRIGAVADPSTLFDGDRLTEPVGYANAESATWLLAFWPAAAFAASGRIPWFLRGLAAALAVVVLDVALLSQSRGSILALPVCAVLLVAVVPGRLRTIAALIPILGAAAAALPKVLDVGDALDGTGAGAVRHAADAADAVTSTVLVLAVAAGVVVALVAAWESFRPPAAATAARVRRGATSLVVAGAVLGAAGGLVAIGDPVHRIDNAWHSFKGGYDDNVGSGSRLTSGLGSNRYDFYRVSLDVFADHPIAGVGADNFFQDYLERGHSNETPRNPHNLALRTLAETGIVGTLLLLTAFLAALAAGWRAMRGADPLAATVAGGAVLAFLYWVVHGMTDWFWEWAGLGAPAFALLGLACALAPRRVGDAETAPAAVRARTRPAVLVAAGAVLVLGALAIAGPWQAERDIERAGAVFAKRPFESYSRLDRAADLDPLSDRPALIEGSIALRYGDLARARSAFEDALDRNARGQYATLELGAIASVQGDRPRALTLLVRAVALAPRDGTAREVLAVVREGGTVDVAALNRRILSAGRRITQG